MSVKVSSVPRTMLMSALDEDILAGVKFTRLMPDEEKFGSDKLPHNVIVEVLSFLEPREIARARAMGKSFRHKLTGLVNSLSASSASELPSAANMKIFERLETITLEGDHNLVRDAMPALTSCSSLRKVVVVAPRHRDMSRWVDPQRRQSASGLLQLSLVEIKYCRVAFGIPLAGVMPAWYTLQALVLSRACIDDGNLVDLFSTIPFKRALPLKHLDLSFNKICTSLSSLCDLLQGGAFPRLDSLDLSGNAICDDEAILLVSALCKGSCERLSRLGMAGTLISTPTFNCLARGISRKGHGLEKLEKLTCGERGIMGKVDCSSLGQALAAGGLPNLRHFHVQCDFFAEGEGALLQDLGSGACRELVIVKIERPELVTPHMVPSRPSKKTLLNMYNFMKAHSFTPHLEELHILGTGWLQWFTRIKIVEDKFVYSSHDCMFDFVLSAGRSRGVRMFI
ncbi:unnamed protein product [Discosporangium mesarthrocarpum]